MHDIFTLKYRLNLLLCSISSGTRVPSCCRRNWSSNIIIDLNTLWKWRLMVSSERQKKDIVRVIWLRVSMWRNLQLAFQPWHAVFLENHHLSVKCHTNLGKLVDPCVLHHSIFTIPKSRHYFIMNFLSFYGWLRRNVGNTFSF